MSPEKDAYLCEKYPKIFVNRNSDVKESCMAWGFEINDGWFHIIDNACKLIQSHIDWRNQQRERAIEFNETSSTEKRQVSEAIPQFVAEQIKEKFGTLRFYYSGGNEYTSGIVSMAEAMSGSTCEVCGKPGSTGGKGWIKTACEEHKR